MKLIVLKKLKGSIFWYKSSNRAIMNEEYACFYLNSCEVFAIKKWSHWNHTKTTINKQNK